MGKNLRDIVPLNEGIDHFFNRSVGTISAERGDLAPEVNAHRTRQLHSDLRAAGHKVVPVKGGYVENHGTPQAKEVHEKSFLVMHHQTGDDGGAIKKTLTHLGKKYGQDSVLHKPANSEVASLHGTNHAQFPGMGKSVAVGKKRNYTGGEFFTEMPNGKRFTFGEDYTMPKELRTIIEALSDTRSKYQKMKDLHDHPTTEPHLKAAAAEWMGRNKPAEKTDAWSHVKDTNFRNAEANRPRGGNGHGDHTPDGFYTYNPDRKTYHGPHRDATTAMDQKGRENAHGFKTRTVHKGASGWKEHSNAKEHGVWHNFDRSSPINPKKQQRDWSDD